MNTQKCVIVKSVLPPKLVLLLFLIVVFIWNDGHIAYNVSPLVGATERGILTVFGGYDRYVIGCLESGVKFVAK